MKIAFVMRGISGSGKSDIARFLAGETGIIHSTDDLRMVDGEYVFNPDKNQEQHEQNYRNFCASLEQGAEIVICDNTNLTHSQYRRYVDAALDAGYRVAVVTIPHPDPEVAAARNHHGVSLELIESMLARWEP